MKLGDRVKFTGYVKRNNKFFDISDDTHNLTEIEQEKLDGDDSIRLEKLDHITLPNPLTGIITGKRSIVKSHDFEWHPHRLEIVSTEWVSVYLVATNLSGFYRVPIEHIGTEVEHETVQR